MGGDDLTNKVWGLGSDETNSLRSRPSQSLYTTSVTSADDQIVYHRDAVKDHSKPSAFYFPDPCTFFPRHVASIGRGSCPSSAGFSDHPAANTNAPHLSDYYAHDRMAHVVNTFQNSIALESKRQDLKNPQQCSLVHASQTAAHVKSHLNSSAPSFVPTSRREVDSYIQRDLTSIDFEHSEAREFSNSVMSRKVHVHPNHDLLTPSSASPRWSPVFPAAIPIAVAGIHNTRIYSPKTDFDDYSNNFFIDKIGYYDTRNILQPETCEKSPRDMFISQTESPHIRKMETLPKAQSPSFFSPSITQNVKLSQSDQTIQSSRKRSFSQQPRSIPFVHLIQRRLPSVAEEDGHKYDLVLSKVQAKGSNMKSSLKTNAISTVQAEAAVREMINAASLGHQIVASGPTTDTTSPR